MTLALPPRHDSPNGGVGSPPRETPAAPTHPIVVFGIPLLLTVLGAAFFARLLLTGSVEDFQAALACLATSIPFWLAASDRPWRALHPLSLLGFTMVLGVAGQTLYIRYADPASANALLSGLEPEILTGGLFVIAIGIVALAVGYLWPTAVVPSSPGTFLRKATRLGLGDPAEPRALVVVVVACVISSVAFAAYAPRVGINSIDTLLVSRKRFVEVGDGHTVFGYHRLAVSLAGTAFLLAVYVITRQGLAWRSRLGLAGGVALAITAIFANATSSRTELLAVVTAAAFTRIALHQREPALPKLATGLVVVMAVVVLMGGLRQVGQGQEESLSDALGLGATLDGTFGSRDWMDVGPISVIVNRVPDQHRFANGSTLISILWAPIPRTVWPAKPAVRMGPSVGKEIFGFDDRRRSGDPPGVLGELWLNGSYLAVVVGMALLGIFLRRVERLYNLVRATDGLSAALFGVLVVTFAVRLPTSDVTGAALGILERLPILLLLLWSSRSRSTATKRSARSGYIPGSGVH